MIKLLILFILISTPVMAMDCKKLNEGLKRCENSEVICYKLYSTGYGSVALQCQFKNLRQYD